MANNSDLALHLLCPSAHLDMFLRCFARLPAGELWRSLRVPLVVAGEISCGRAVNYSSGGLKGLSLCPLPFTIPLSRPSRLLWAPYLSGLKGPGRPISKKMDHEEKKKGGCLVCTKDGHKENGTKGNKEWKEGNEQLCQKNHKHIMF